MKFTYEKIMQRDRVSLDIFWLKHEILKDLENIASSEEITVKIEKNLEEFFIE